MKISIVLHKLDNSYYVFITGQPILGRCTFQRENTSPKRYSIGQVFSIGRFYSLQHTFRYYSSHFHFIYPISTGILVITIVYHGSNDGNSVIFASLATGF